MLKLLRFEQNTGVFSDTISISDLGTTVKLKNMSHAAVETKRYMGHMIRHHDESLYKLPIYPYPFKFPRIHTTYSEGFFCAF